ncbi:MAG: hypothetical protein NZ699_04215 [Roseiflexus sp.]|nr:hypothetical protein [Roseiflexus sp.]MDW8148932.1 hypothetical protein [Roseiflexaceae bacterium]
MAEVPDPAFDLVGRKRAQLIHAVIPALEEADFFVHLLDNRARLEGEHRLGREAHEVITDDEELGVTAGRAVDNEGQVRRAHTAHPRIDRYGGDDGWRKDRLDVQYIDRDGCSGDQIAALPELNRDFVATRLARCEMKDGRRALFIRLDGDRLFRRTEQLEAGRRQPHLDLAGKRINGLLHDAFLALLHRQRDSERDALGNPGVSRATDVGVADVTGFVVMLMDRRLRACANGQPLCR